MYVLAVLLIKLLEMSGHLKGFKGGCEDAWGVECGKIMLLKAIVYLVKVNWCSCVCFGKVGSVYIGSLLSSEMECVSE